METTMAATTLTLPAADASPPPPALSLGSACDVILALDLGATTGWAVRSIDGAITSGTAEFRLDRWQSGGMRFLRFKRWLTEIKNQVGGFDLVVYEQVRRHAGVDAAHAFGGWLAILTAWCDHHGIAYQGVPVGTIKRFIAGKGNADKAAVIAAVRARGFNPADDNEADAIAILLWAIETQGGVR
jgi:Holliday junction resolvasome RuvABC endonuclease subunit